MKLLIVGLLAASVAVSVYADENNIPSSTAAPTSTVPLTSSASTTLPSSSTASVVTEAATQAPTTPTTTTITTTTTTTTATPTTTIPVRTRGKLTTTTTATTATTRSPTTLSSRTKSEPSPNAVSGTSRGARKYQTGRELGNEVGTKSFETKADHDMKSYKFAYETEDGQKRDEQVNIENQGTDEENLVVKGHYSFVAADGFEYIFSYVADDRGYRPVITVKKPANS